MLPGRLPCRHEHVGRLDVEVHQASRVHRVQRVGHLTEQPQRPRHGQRTAVDHAREVGPLDVAHRDVEVTVGLIEVVQRDDVGVVDRGRVAGLVDEAFAELAVGGQRLVDDLERDAATQAGVGGAVEDAHAAAADDPVDAEVTETLPGQVLRAPVGHAGTLTPPVIRIGAERGALPRSPTPRPAAGDGPARDSGDRAARCPP